MARRRSRNPGLPAQLEQVHLHAAGIDVGSEFHWVAIPADDDSECVRKFNAFTSGLEALADWLKQCQVQTVVMESTGVYWIPLFELLDSRGFEVLLVDPRRLKNVPGRKTDVLDCQWLQQLHTFGLLAGAFRPPEQICTLRAYVRQRAMLVESAARHVQHMQKALHQMNVKLD
jgi:transposase